MIEAVWNPKQKKIWVAFTLAELRRMARSDEREPLDVPIIMHPVAGAVLRIQTTQIEALGAGDVFWWDSPAARRVVSPRPSTLYCVLDTLRFRALCQIDKAEAVGVRFLSNPVRWGTAERGSHLLWTMYDDDWHDGKLFEQDGRMKAAVNNWRQDRARAKNPALANVRLNWTPLAGVHDGVSAKEK